MTFLPNPELELDVEKWPSGTGYQACP